MKLLRKIYYKPENISTGRKAVILLKKHTGLKEAVIKHLS